MTKSSKTQLGYFIDYRLWQDALKLLRNFHENFKSIIKQETNSETQDKIVLKLDIENYFNELSIPRLLNFLSCFIKPSIKANLVYDTFTREQITCLFQFICNVKSGIPQSDNNIISSFNSVSHPGSDGNFAWKVTKEEYLDYYEHIGQCLDFLL